jgi:hypothetical protein
MNSCYAVSLPHHSNIKHQISHNSLLIEVIFRGFLLFVAEKKCDIKTKEGVSYFETPSFIRIRSMNEFTDFCDQLLLPDACYYSMISLWVTAVLPAFTVLK